MLIRADDYFFYSLKLSCCYIRLDTVPRPEWKVIFALIHLKISSLASTNQKQEVRQLSKLS